MPGGQDRQLHDPRQRHQHRGNAFFGCTGLTSITIPDSVTSIGGGAFQFCTGLTNVVIGNRVRHLSGFDRCTGLTSITIPNSVARIERYAFSSCTGMTNIVIPDSVSSIGEGAFSRCTGLTSLTMGKGVTSIEWSAFSGCTGLTSVYFEGNAPADDGACLETPATIYYLPGTTGWEPTYSDRPTAVWVRIEPVILDFGPSFGVQPKGFGFRISWSTNANVVVEACTNLARPAWSPREHQHPDRWLGRLHRPRLGAVRGPVLPRAGE
ncbi:MAG: leucine-rich repeat domain-containing protein [Verrucomicrobia bacterium]|nr:leucine-rich repeat domain-containing protein [Verrucomicrobiota bacterium]